MKKALILIICGLTQICFAAENSAQGQSDKNLSPKTDSPTLQQSLPDGYVINRIDGKIISQQDKFYFAPDTDLTDGKNTIIKGQNIQLLPSSTLEKIEHFTQNQTTAIRLSATVTKYNSQNFLFPTNFIAITEPQETENNQTENKNTETQQTEAQQTEAEQRKLPDKDSDKTKDSILPDDVLKKLNKPTVIPKKTTTKNPIRTEPDRILHRRTGFVTFQDGKTLFEIDALGRNLDSTRFQLLPCRLTENLEYKTNEAPAPQRIKTTGIITKYKGTCYLLPTQAVRTYNHGNFAR